MGAGERALRVEKLLAETVWVSALAHGLLHDEHEAEDVAQDVRLAALKCSPSDPGHARSWLVRVTRNLALRARLRRSRRERREQGAAASERLPSAEELVARVEAQRRVAAAVLALAEPYRTVVLLRYFDALTARDVASKLGVPVETVRTRLKRALEKLRVALDHELGRAQWAALLLPSGVHHYPPLAASTGTSGTAAVGATALTIAGGVATVSLVTKWSLASAVAAVAGLVAWMSFGSKVEFQVGEDQAMVDANSSPTPATTAPVIESLAASDRLAAPVRSTEPEPANADAPAESSFRFLATILDARDQQPIDGALLELRYALRDSHVLEHATATSDATGRLELSVASIAAWGIGIEVRSPDHSPFVNDFVQIGRAVDRAFDFGVIELVRGAAVAGRVVRSESGAPIAGADLWLLREGAGQNVVGLTRSRRVGTTRDDGTFELLERAYSPHSHPLILFAVAGDGIGWAIFEVLQGRESVEDLEIEVGPNARLHVMVRDEGGTPVASASVNAEPRFAPLGPASYHASAHAPQFGQDPRIVSKFSSSSDARGEVLFTALPIGRAHAALKTLERGPFDAYDVSASKEGHDLGFVDRVRVTADRTMECEIVLRRSTKWSIVGCVMDHDGAGVAGARVREMGSGVAAVSADDGEFRLEGVPSVRSRVAIEVNADGFRAWQRWFAAENLVKEAEGDAAAGVGPTWRVDATLDRRARIAGRVVDESGAPIADAPVWLAPMKEEEGVSITYRPDPPTTDAEGRFVFDNASEEEWRITAFPPAEGTWHTPTLVNAHGGDEDVKVVIRREEFGGARLLAEIFEAPTGRPAEPSEVSIQPLFAPARLAPIRVDRALGKVECWPLVEGRWQLIVKLTNGWSVVRDIDVPGPDDLVRLRIEVHPPGRVEATVELEPHLRAGLPDLEMRWDPGNGLVRYDASGRLVADSLTPGRQVRFFIQCEELFDEATVTPLSGETTRITLRPRLAGFVQLQVDAALPPGVILVDFSSNGGPWHSRSIDAGATSNRKPGRQSVLPGHHRWRARFVPTSDLDPDAPRSTRSILEGEFDVSAGETRILELDWLD